MSVRHDAGDASGWFGVPWSKDPRWVLPRESRRVARASLGVYQPLTVKGRIGWEAARALASLGVFHVLPGDAAPPSRVRELVDPYIPTGGAIAVARTNHAGRWVALTFAPDGSPVAAAKVASDPIGRRALALEASNLERFARLLPFPLSAPRILGQAEEVLVV